MEWWVEARYQQWGMAGVGIWVFWVLLSISLHELAHGWAAIWEGDDTPIVQQRMTLNPFVQMGTTSLIVFAIAGIAWGMMPVNPYRFRHRKYGDAIVSAAGPAMNLLLALVSGIGLVVLLRYGIGLTWPGYDAAWGSYVGVAKSDQLAQWQQALVLFFATGFVLNVVLLLLNLIPVPPLDGSRILACFSRRADQLYRHPEMANYALIAVFAVLFLLGPRLWQLAMFLGQSLVNSLLKVLS